LIKNLIWTLFFLAAFLGNKAWSIGFEDGAFPEIFVSSRALAMGNAYLGKTDDAWATFYNPAGLGTVRKSRIHLFNIHGEFNKALMDVSSSGSTTEIPTNVMNILDVEKARTLLANTPGKPIHTRMGFFPNFTTRFFSTGFVYSQRNRLFMETAASDYEVAERIDYGPTVAANFSLLGGIFKFGISAIWLIRKQYQNTFANNATITIADSDYQTGNMLYYTGGFRMTLPMWGLPSLSAVVRNARDSEFNKSGKGSTAPNQIPRTVDIGLSFTPQIGRSSRFHLEINYKDVSNKTNTDQSRRLTGGFELDFKRAFFVRAGYGDGYGSFGLGVRSKKVIVDLTTYAVDTTDGAYRGQEDRRFALSISSGY
jgi:hypothetical protein